VPSTHQQLPVLSTPIQLHQQSQPTIATNPGIRSATSPPQPPTAATNRLLHQDHASMTPTCTHSHSLTADVVPSCAVRLCKAWWSADRRTALETATQEGINNTSKDKIAVLAIVAVRCVQQQQHTTLLLPSTPSHLHHPQFSTQAAAKRHRQHRQALVSTQGGPHNTSQPRPPTHISPSAVQEMYALGQRLTTPGSPSVSSILVQGVNDTTA
jgi:hypothetical protein